MQSTYLKNSVVTVDIECSTHNKGNPFDARNMLVSIHTKVNDDATVCKFYDEPDFKTPIITACNDAQLIVGHNVKFDLHWLAHSGIAPRGKCRVWCTMVAEFVLSGQTSGFTSLNELCELYGLPQKLDLVKQHWDAGVSTEDIPRDIVAEYGNHDVDLTYQVYLKQQDDHRMNPELNRLIKLMCADLLVLQEMEYHGQNYNVVKSLELAASMTQKKDDIEKELLGIAGVDSMNFNSDDQLSAFLYGGTYEVDKFEVEHSVFKSGPRKGEVRTINRKVSTDVVKLDGIFNPLKGTELKKEGLYSTAADILKQLKATTKMQKRVIGLLLERAKLDKVVGTYYQGLPDLIEEMHWKDNVIHGQFNQTVARTGRLSSSKPNLQNTTHDVDILFESRFV